jgi:hypothetical protein
MKRKLALVVLLSVLSGTVFVGCGDNTSTPTPAPTNAPPAK